MKPSLREDVIAILAIVASAALGVRVSAGLFPRSAEHPIARVEIRMPDMEQRRLVIPDGYRAVTVRVDDVAATAGWVRPGSQVDLVLLPDDLAADADSRLRVVVEGVQVLGNDRTVSRDVNGESVASSMLTVLVTPEQAEKLSNAAVSGTMHVVLRNSDRPGRITVVDGRRRLRAESRR